MQQSENHISFHEYADVEIVQGKCNHAFPPHIHEVLCIGQIIDGFAEFSMNGRREILSAGDMYVIPPYTLHTLSSMGAGMFSYHVVCFKNPAVLKRFDGIVSSAKTYIENTMSEFSIDALSDTVHISKYHLDRIFKEQLGITPYQFYIGDRIKKIRQGLQAHLPLPDIVYDLNFFDQSHLCHTFRKHMGISPTQYACSYQYD